MAKISEVRDGVFTLSGLSVAPNRFSLDSFWLMLTYFCLIFIESEEFST